MLTEVKLFFISPANQQRAQTTASALRADIPGEETKCHYANAHP